MKRGPMSQLPTGLQDEVPMAFEILVNALTPNEVVNRIARDSRALEEEVQAKSPRGPNGTKSRPCLVSSVGGHHLKDLEPPAWSAVDSNALLGQQAHEVGGGVGVQSQRRHRDIGSRMGPVLVVIVQACECGMRVGGLSQHHFSWKESAKHHEVAGQHITLHS